jgi:Domain of unknown function (DUF6249)
MYKEVAMTDGYPLFMFMFMSVASAALFSFLAVASWSDSRRREREAFYTSETLKKVAESPAPGGNIALEYLREQEKRAERRRREGIKLGGQVTSAVGVGLMIFLKALVKDQEPVYLCGLIPLFIGVALLGYSYFLAPKE